MGVISAYRRVLRNPALARLLFGEFVSSVGDWLYLVALLVVVYAEADDALALGIIGAARVLPYVILSVPAGIVADRFDRRLVLITTDVARGVIMLLIAAAVAFGAPVAVIVGLAILATCFSAFFSPTIGAFLPTLVRDESELGPANSAWSSLDNLAFFLGPAVAAVLLAIGGMVVAFLLNALTFAVVALVLLGIRAPKRASVVDEAQMDDEAQPSTTSLRTRLRPIYRPLAGLAVLNVAGGFVFGGLGVLTVILAVDVFGAGEAGTGLLNSAIGVGGVVGALTAGALVLRRRLGPPMLGGALVVGAGVALLGVVPNFPLALVAIAAASAGALLVEIVATTLFQRIVPDDVRGRALGVMETLSVLAYAAGSFAIPVAAAAEPGLVLAAAGLLMGGGGVLAIVLLGSHAIVAPPIDELRRRIADVPLFAGLPPARLEAAMSAALPVAVAPGQRIIEQGAEPDRFYVIAEGRVEVSQRPADGGPEVVLRQMGPGEFFGEIGLLANVPRTASVTTLEEGRLLALERDDFNDLVRAGPGLTYRLLDLHRGTSSAAA